MQPIRVVLYTLLSGMGFLLLRLPSATFLQIQIGLTVLFVVGACFEVYAARYRVMVLPPALFTAFSFVNNMIAGIWYFVADMGSVTQFSTADFSIVRGSWYTLIAVQVLWVAFYALPDDLLRLKVTGTINRIPPTLIYSLVAVSLACFVAAVRLNVYGYVADPTNVNYLSYLRFGINLGWLAIILIAAYEWEQPGRRRLLTILVIGYFLIGLLYGSKSTAVMPVALVIVSLYVSGRRMRPRYFVAAVLAAGVAYAVIEPFRVYYALEGQQGETRSVSDLANMYVAAQDVVDQSQINYVSSVMDRQSYVSPLAKTLEFADDNRYHYDEEWHNLALSPLYGVIPRFIWQSKPLANSGAWASVNIFDLPETTSTGITPQGYAYLVARLWGIVLFFLLFGLIQRLVFSFLYLNRAFLPLYILAYFDVGYPVTPSTFVAGTLQSLLLMSPLLLLLLYLCRRQTPGSHDLSPAPA